MARFPIIEAGDHACVWNVDGAPLSGSIKLLTERSPSGRIYDYPHTIELVEGGTLSASFPQKFTRDRVRGTIRGKCEVAALGVTIQILLPESGARFIAKTALCGTLPPEELTFSKIEFQVGGLTEVFGTAPVKETRWPEDLTVDGGEFAMKWNPAAWSTVVHDDYDLDLNFHVTAKNFNPYQFSVITKPVVSIKGPPMDVDAWIKQYVDPFRGLAELATSQAQPINWLTVAHKYDRHGNEERSRAQVFTSGISQESYDADQMDATRPLLFTVRDSEVTADKLISGWRRLNEEYPTFTQLYNSTVRDQLAPRSHFLVLMPALESFHAKKFGVQEKDPETHKAEVEAIFKKAKEGAFSAADQKWLKRFVKTRTDYSLAKRLRMLVELLPEPLQERLREATGGKSILNSEIDKMASVRNDLAHGGDSWANDELAPYIRLATTIGKGLILGELGIPPERLIGAIDSRMWVTFKA